MSKAPPIRQGLTEKQSAFVRAYIANGGNGAQAARAAGYDSHPSQQAWRLLQQEGIQAALHQAEVRKFGELSAKALCVLGMALDRAERELTEGKPLTAKHIDVAVRVLDRRGHVAKTKEKPRELDRPDDQLTPRQLEDRIARLIEKRDALIEGDSVDVTPEAATGA